MSTIASWILSILSIVIIGTILDIFLSEKKLGKAVRSVIASLLVLVIITPIPALFNGITNCSGIFNNSVIELDENFLNYANSQKIGSLQSGVESAYAQAGYKNIKVKITANIDVTVNITAVKIIITDLVIDNPLLNINKIEKIIDLCIEFLGVSKDIVTVQQ